MSKIILRLRSGWQYKGWQMVFASCSNHPAIWHRICWKKKTLKAFCINLSIWQILRQRILSDSSSELVLPQLKLLRVIRQQIQALIFGYLFIKKKVKASRRRWAEASHEQLRNLYFYMANIILRLRSGWRLLEFRQVRTPADRTNVSI